jgi:RimJ/RimL family protein N-acetyltransferase
MRAPETLATPRLTLRRPGPQDAGVVFDYASDPEVTRFLAWPRHTTIGDSREFLRLSDELWAVGPGPYLIVDGDGGVVGSSGLGVETPYRAATGYVLARRVWGRGYATEVAVAMAGLAVELGIGRLYALCHLENRASARVLAKAGFTYEGVLGRHTVFPNLDPTAAQDVECWARTTAAGPARPTT